MQVKLIGLTEFKKKMSPQRYRDAEDATIDRILTILQVTARKEAPVDTGVLRNSIQTKKQRNLSGIIGTVYSGKKYAEYVHDGTRRGIKPNPFFDRSIQQKREAVNRIARNIFISYSS